MEGTREVTYSASKYFHEPNVFLQVHTSREIFTFSPVSPLLPSKPCSPCRRGIWFIYNNRNTTLNTHNYYNNENFSNNKTSVIINKNHFKYVNFKPILSWMTFTYSWILKGTSYSFMRVLSRQHNLLTPEFLHIWFLSHRYFENWMHQHMPGTN